MREGSFLCNAIIEKRILAKNRFLDAKVSSKFDTLHVGEMRENGYLTGIYRMDGEKMAAEGN